MGLTHTVGRIAEAKASVSTQALTGHWKLHCTTAGKSLHISQWQWERAPTDQNIQRALWTIRQYSRYGSNYCPCFCGWQQDSTHGDRPGLVSTVLRCGGHFPALRGSLRADLQVGNLWHTFKQETAHGSGWWMVLTDGKTVTLWHIVTVKMGRQVTGCTTDTSGF